MKGGFKKIAVALLCLLWGDVALAASKTVSSDGVPVLEILGNQSGLRFSAVEGLKLGTDGNTLCLAETKATSFIVLNVSQVSPLSIPLAGCGSLAKESSSSQDQAASCQVPRSAIPSDASFLISGPSGSLVPNLNVCIDNKTVDAVDCAYQCGAVSVTAPKTKEVKAS